MDAGGSQLIVSARIGQCASDRNDLVADIAAIPAVLGRPETVLADNGYANGAEVAALEASGIEVLVSTAAEGRRRTHDFRPVKALPAVKGPKADWLKAMRKSGSSISSGSRARKDRHWRSFWGSSENACVRGRRTLALNGRRTPLEGGPYGGGEGHTFEREEP